MSRVGLTAAVVVAGATTAVAGALLAGGRAGLGGLFCLNLVLLLLWALASRLTWRAWAATRGRGEYRTALERTRLVYRSVGDRVAVFDASFATLYLLARYGGGKLLDVVDVTRSTRADDQLFELVLIPPSAVDVEVR